MNEEIGVREAAKLLGIHENTLRNWANDGRVPFRELPVSGYKRFLRTDIQKMLLDKVSYHDVHVTTRLIERTSIFNLPFGYELTCNRVSGWRLYNPKGRLVAGEYDEGLRIDVAGVIILDTIKEN